MNFWRYFTVSPSFKMKLGWSFLRYFAIPTLRWDLKRKDFGDIHKPFAWFCLCPTKYHCWMVKVKWDVKSCPFISWFMLVLGLFGMGGEGVLGDIFWTILRPHGITIRHPKIGRRHILMQDALVWQLCFLSMQPIDWFAESVFLAAYVTQWKGPLWTHSFGPGNRVRTWEGGGGRATWHPSWSSLTWPGFEVMNEALASKGEDEPAPADEAWVW